MEQKIECSLTYTYLHDPYLPDQPLCDDEIYDMRILIEDICFFVLSTTIV